MAKAAKKPKEDWPRLLEPYLTGKAQKAFYALKEEDKKDFQKIVDIILRHYQLTSEAYRVKFRSATKEHQETFEEFATRLELYFKRWLKPSNETAATADIKRIFEQLLIDQFLSTIKNDNLRLKLREKKLTTVQAVARCADEHVLNRRMENTSASTHPRQSLTPQPDNSDRRTPAKLDNTNPSNHPTGSTTTAAPRKTGGLS